MVDLDSGPVTALLRRFGFAVVALMLLGSMMGETPARAQGTERPQLSSPRAHKIVNHPEFAWKSVRGATKYELQVAQDRRFTEIFKETETPATRFTDRSTWPSGSYWWRVRVTEPSPGRWSRARTFTRRWLVPDADTGKREVARVDNLEIEDFSDAPGVQVPENAINLRWDPVADASYYVVQFDPLETFDPDLPPPGEGAPSVCVTPHTVLTPNTESVGLPEQGPALIAEAASTPCEIEKGAYWVRVRAVDRRVDEEPLYSLWSDEARSPDVQPPGAVLLHVRGTSAGTDDRAPAELLEPHNGDIFLDTPVLKWRPVNWADQYKVVIALDRDFTTEVGHFFTTNTRFAPLERIPENAALRSYYWYVVPCRGADGTPLCISSNQVVNRTGAFRSFQKKSPIPRTLSPKKHRRGAWTRFVWKAFTSTVRKGNAKHFRPQDAIGGIDHYEFQTRPKRSLTWPDEVIKTDLPILLPTELPFGARYEWRVRVVDGSGQTRPWSHERLVRTPRAVPNNPVGLQAFRSAGKVRLLWRTPKSRFFPVTGYSIYYSLNGKRWKPLGRVVRTKATFRVGKGTRYWFMVTANNYAGDSPPSRVFVGR